MDDAYYNALDAFCAPSTPDEAFVQNTRRLYLAFLKEMQIPPWILLGIPSKEEWILKRLFMTDEEIEAGMWKGSNFSHSQSKSVWR